MKNRLNEEEKEILQLYKNQKLVISKDRNEKITKAVKSAKAKLTKLL